MYRVQVDLSGVAIHTHNFERDNGNSEGDYILVIFDKRYSLGVQIFTRHERGKFSQYLGSVWSAGRGKKRRVGKI